MLKIFNCLKTVRSRYINLFLLLSVLYLWLTVPGVVSAQVVDIPDPGLRAAIAEALNTAPGDAITRADMETLVQLVASERDITDLRGIEFAINLTSLSLWFNTISDISPLSSLKNLTSLSLWFNTISDISPLSSLTNLTSLSLWFNTISDISPLSSLTNLRGLGLRFNTISDISPLSSLKNLTSLDLGDNTISDMSPLSSLTNLESLSLYNNNISNISPLAGLTNLTELHLWDNNISDISAVGNLINLRYLSLGGNNISNIIPLILLTNLTHLHIPANNVSDIDTLNRLMAQGTVVYFRDNPAFETPGPKIEDGWVWLIVPATNVNSGSQAASSGRDFLSEASGGAVTEADVARDGAQEGTRVGDSVWTAATLNATNSDNLNAIVRDHNLGTDIRYPVAYGVVSIRSETQQQTRLYIGGAPVKVWVNGTLVYRDTHHRNVNDYETAVPVTLNAGNNLLFIAAYKPSPWTSRWGAFFGFQDGTGYTVPVEEVVYMYWVDSGTDKIQRAHLDGSNVEDIITTGLRTPTNISLDNSSSVYWTDSGTDKIQRANLDGSNITDVITTGLRTPTGVELDTFWGNIYWIDSGTDKIQYLDLADDSIGDFVTTGLRTPTDIALDPYDPQLGKVYWIDSGTDKIQRVNFDGSNIQDLVTTGLRTPTSIALDLVRGKMYWTDSGTDKIQRADLDGSNIEDIITTGLRTPTGIAIDYTGDGKVYWVDSGTDKIQRADLDGSNIEDLVTTGLRTPTGIALNIPQIFSTAPPPEPPPGPGPGPDPGSVDVNGDGQVTVIDLAIVALFYGTQVPAGMDFASDVNADGTVDINDLIAVAEAIDAANTIAPLSADDVAAVLEAIADIEAIAEAPARFSRDRTGIAYRNVAAAFADAKHRATEDARLGKWMPLLKELLHRLSEMREIPDTTALLPNYPNPFNPETWIPYHLAQDANVTLTIYDVSGKAVRELPLGHQSAGIYESRGRAAYWDGKNRHGEPVASGVYFYTLTAGEFTATRKMLIVK